MASTAGSARDGQKLWLCGSNIYGWDFRWERPEHFRLVPVTVHGKSFQVGSVHSHFIQHSEKGPLEVFHKTLVNASHPCYVIDVGMNDGFYTQFTASYGCQVWSFELQPSCIQLARRALIANNFTTLATILQAPVSNKHGELMKIPHGNERQRQRCDGGFSLAGEDANMKAHLQFEIEGYYQRHTVRLDRFFPTTGVSLDLVKVDVEGFDSEVLTGAEALLANHQIKHLVVEVTPKVWSVPLAEGLEIYKRILTVYGYHARCITFMPKKRIPVELYQKEVLYHRFEALLENCVDWEFFL
eukprot:scaffold2785_cov165-Ochromonas_danica.AAC.8